MSYPFSLHGLKVSITLSIDGAEVFGVVLLASDHAKISSGVILTPSSYSLSPIKTCSGTISILYLSTISFDKSHVLSDIIFTIAILLFLQALLIIPLFFPLIVYNNTHTFHDSCVHPCIYSGKALPCMKVLHHQYLLLLD